jgi:hypothetical protein
MTKDELHLLDKRALEDYGRTFGVELDRRLSKSKLVEQVLSAQVSFNSASVVIADIDSVPLVTTVAPPVRVSVVAPVVVKKDKYELVRQGDSWSVSLGIKQVYKSSSEAAAKRWMNNH